MDKRQIFGIFGAGMVLIGVFLPIVEWPPNTYSLFGRGSLSGISVLLFSIAAFVLTMKQQYTGVLLTAVGIATVILFRFYDTWDTVSVMNDAATTLRRLGSTRGAIRPELQFGWGVLFAGTGLLLAASAGAAQSLWRRVTGGRNART